MAKTGSPSFKKHAKFLEGKDKAKVLKTRIVEIQAQRAVKDSRFLQVTYNQLSGCLHFFTDS